jgi:hypothetical protein
MVQELVCAPPLVMVYIQTLFDEVFAFVRNVLPLRLREGKIAFYDLGMQVLSRCSLEWVVP